MTTDRKFSWNLRSLSVGVSGVPAEMKRKESKAPLSERNVGGRVPRDTCTESTWERAHLRRAPGWRGWLRRVLGRCGSGGGQGFVLAVNYVATS